MVKWIIRAVFKLVILLVDVVLTPLNLVISTFYPDISNVVSMINGYFDYLGDYASIAISYLGFNSTVVSSVILLLTAIITLPLATHIIKLAVHWYNYLKP